MRTQIKWLCMVLTAAWCSFALAQTPPAPPPTASTQAVVVGTPAEMTAPQATAVLSKRLPGLFASKDEVNAFWSERLKASLVMFDSAAAIEALPKIAALETDPAKRLKVYKDVASVFSKKGKTNEQMRIDELILGDDALMPSARALTAAGLAHNWGLSDDLVRANSLLNTAKMLQSKTSQEEDKSLTIFISLEIARAELGLMFRKGDTHQMARQAALLQSIRWDLYLNAATPGLKRDALIEYVRHSRDYVNNLVPANRANQALTVSKETIRLIADQKITDFFARLNTLSGLSSSLTANGMYSQALESYEQAMKMCDVAKALPTHNNCNLVRLERARTLFVLNRAAEGIADVDYIRQGRAQSQVISGNFSEDELTMLGAAGRADWSAARIAATKKYDFAVRWGGYDSAFARDAAAMLMLVNLHDPTYVLSKTSVERFLSGYLAAALDWGDGGKRGWGCDMAAIEEILQRIIDGQGKLGADDATDLAFAAAEYLRNGSSQAALFDGAVKLAATDPDLRVLIEKEQTLRGAQGERRTRVARQLTQAERLTAQKADDSVVKRQQDAVKEAQAQLDAEDARLQAVRKEIAQRFPVYQELSNPRIPTAKELAGKLRPSEAYLAMYSGRNGGAVFVVSSQGRLTLHKVAQTSASVQAMVKAMRKSFDASAVPTAPGQWSGFDVTAAAALYQHWLAVAMPDLAGVNVLHLATGGALSSVPWAATLTEVPTSLQTASWLGASKVITITPGASSVVLNRSIKGKLADKPFIAFANPQFAKTTATSATTPSAQLPASRNPLVRAVSGDFDYAQIAPLPETLEEANAAAKSAGADPAKDVISGAAATRTRVLAEKLDDRRLVAFATHGVLPGDIPRLIKPALAMAYEGAGAADSLLTTDDIISLRLNADWVLLSACNTGLTESGGGETISGMARSFFAAGAKSVLATQWSVESESAKQLVVNTLATYGAADATLGKAQALATAQRAMASGKQGALYQHPYFWAAYFLMGEPQR